MDIKTKRTIIFVLGMAVVLTVIGTISYAFFSPLGESNLEQATISTGTARVKFRDNDMGITGELSFGESITKSFTIENSGTVEVNIKMYFKDLVNTYLKDSLTYTLSHAETRDGPFTEIVTKTNVPRTVRPASEILANSLTIPAGRTYYYNLVITLNNLPEVNQDADITAKFSTTFNIQDISYKDPGPSEKTLVALGQTSNGIKTNFDDSATTDEGIYEMEDNYGTSYYYRGAVEDNYVVFGKWRDNAPTEFWGRNIHGGRNNNFTSLDDCNSSTTHNINCTAVEKAGKDMYWRIIRINGDGSIRLVYDGTEPHTIDDDNCYDRIVSVGAWNNQVNDAKYAGYMYGGLNSEPSTSKENANKNETDSLIKQNLDKWYLENFSGTIYEKYIVDNVFCNDRSTVDTPSSYGKRVSDTGLGYGNNPTVYGYWNRVNYDSSSVEPNFICKNKNDAFTVRDTEKGNGALTYPVGLITADETITAGGGHFTSNKKFYLYRNDWFWTMTPGYFSNNEYFHTVNSSRSDVYITSHFTSFYDVGIVPVINISREYASTMIGTGTIMDPYRESQ